MNRNKKGGFFMKRFLLTILIFIVLFPIDVSGRSESYKETVTYNYGENQSLEQAFEYAKWKATKQVLEARVGTIIKSTTSVKNH